MHCYSVHDRQGVLASVLTDISEPEKFGKEMHDFMCGDDFSDRSHLTINDFGEHMRNKGYDCQVFIHETDYHWWLQDPR